MQAVEQGRLQNLFISFPTKPPIKDKFSDIQCCISFSIIRSVFRSLWGVERRWEEKGQVFLKRAPPFQHVTHPLPPESKIATQFVLMQSEFNFMDRGLRVWRFETSSLLYLITPISILGFKPSSMAHPHEPKLPFPEY